MSIKKPAKKPSIRTRIAVGAALSASAALGLTAVAVAPASAMTVTPYAMAREPVYVTTYNVTGYVFNEGAFCTQKGMALSSYQRAPWYVGDTYITCVYWVYA